MFILLPKACYLTHKGVGLKLSNVRSLPSLRGPTTKRLTMLNLAPSTRKAKKITICFRSWESGFSTSGQIDTGIKSVL